MRNVWLPHNTLSHMAMGWAGGWAQTCWKRNGSVSVAARILWTEGTVLYDSSYCDRDEMWGRRNLWRNDDKTCDGKRTLLRPHCWCSGYSIAVSSCEQTAGSVPSHTPVCKGHSHCDPDFPFWNLCRDLRYDANIHFTFPTFEVFEAV
jgi:hypothetical protein